MDVIVRQLEERDIADADRIFRVAFGTFLGVPDPATFGGDAEMVRTRWRADPARTFAAEAGGRLVGSNIVTNWGSFGFFGPLTVHPDLWDRGIASHLLDRTMALFDEWGTEHAGLYTFSNSARHIHLYQKYGFWPRSLTASMTRPVGQAQRRALPVTLSAMTEMEREACLRECLDLTDAAYPGLDVSIEIRAVQEQGLGETVLLRDGDALAGLAVCHCGRGSEARSGLCYIKFAAVRPGAAAAANFERLLADCEALAAARGLSELTGGVNAAREEAYRLMVARGFRTEMLGVAMQRPNEPGFNRPGIYVIDDWR